MKILFVDDDQACLSMVGELLRAHGHKVVLAEDGKQAREILEAEEVDLIVSDVFMQTLDGTKFHSYVREFLGARSTPFIFYSGFIPQDTRHMIEDSTIDFFVSKSSPMKDLITLIERVESSGEQKPNRDPAGIG